MPEEKIINLGEGINVSQPTSEPKVPNLSGQVNFPYISLDFSRTDSKTGVAGGNLSPQDIWNNTDPGKTHVPQLPLSSIYIGNRYKSSRPYETDLEEKYAQQQSALDQWKNGALKFVGTAANSFISGTAGTVYGLGAMVRDGRFASLFDNEVNRKLDDSYKALEDALPNYMTQKQTDANWYSPDYLLTANFFSDGILKNLGYSLGAIGGGFAWSKALKALGVTSKLVKAGQGLEALTAVEESMSAVPRLQKFAAFDGALNSVAQKYLMSPAASVLRNSDRIITSATATFGEAGLEGLQNMNAFRDNAIQEYINKYGETPTGKDLDAINAYADKVGNFTWGMNSLLLTATNYIQLPKILGSSRKADAALINDVEQTVIGGDWTKYLPKTRLGKIGSGIRNVGGLIVSPSEGFEEGAQFAIQTGVNDYFNRAYRNKKDVSSFLTNTNNVMGNIVDYGIDQTLYTKEGMSNVLMGALSGGLQQAGYAGMYQDEQGKTKFGFGKSGELGERGLLGYGGERGRNTDIAINALNQTNSTAVLKDLANYIGIGIGSQKARQAAIVANDKMTEKDMEHDFTLSYLMPRVKYGKMDAVNQELSYYKSQAMDNVGFEELIADGIVNANESKEQFVQRLDNLSALAKQVEDTYSMVRERYSNLADRKGNRLYNDKVIDKLVYATAKVGNYDVRIPRVNSILNETGIDTSEILQSIISGNEPNKQATQDVLDQINSMDVISDIKEDLKTALADVIDLSLNRRKYIQEYDAIKKDPKGYEEMEEEFGAEEEVPVTIEQEQGKTKKTITEKKLEVGKEYSLSEPIRKEGNRLIVSPKIAVLSQTLGGEYEVRLPNGEIDFMSPEEFKQFNISDIDNVDAEIDNAIDKAVDSTLKKKKYSDISIPEGENKLDYINSLNNPELVDDVIKEVEKQTKEYIKERQNEEAVLKNEEVEKVLLETLDNNSNLFTTSNDQGEFEQDSKKSGEIAIGASVPSKKIPGYERSMQFLNKLSSLPNREEFKVAYVTQSTEKLLIPGLVNHLAQGKTSVKQETTIAAVVVKRGDDGNLKLVDINGEEVTTDPLNSAIYQVMPLEDLKWSEEFGGESMIRKNQLSQEPALKKIYAKRRANILDARDLTAYDFIPSMGNLVKGDGMGSSVLAAGLIKQSDLSNKNVLLIPTTGDILEKGSTYFTNPLGMVFLDHPDGYIRLQNKQNSEEEATVIFDVLLKLATNVFKPDGINSPESQFLVDWLRSVTHWGSPAKGKTPGKNSLWFDKDETRTSDKFRLKGFDLDTSFRPTSLKQNRTQIIAALANMYNNINNSKLTDVNKSYAQILGISQSGEIKTKDWNNYQTYLLSGEGRTPDQIPLVTMAAPVSEGGYNREGIYMIMSGFNDVNEVDAVNIIKKDKKAKVEGKRSTFGFKVESTGETENLQYTVDDDGNVEIIDSATNDEIIERLMDDELTAKKFEKRYEETINEDSSNIPLEELIKTVAKDVIEERIAARQTVETEEIGKSGKTADDLAAGLDAYILGKEATKPTPKKTAPAPTPTAPVSDNNFSTKSIEKRKKQIEIEGYKFYKLDDIYDVEDNDEGIVAERINSLEEAVIIAEKLYTLKNISQDEDGDWGSGLEYGFEGKTKQEVIDKIKAKYNAELAAIQAPVVSDARADIERRRQEELKPFKNLSFEEALSIINKGEAPKITFSFAGREDSNSYLEKPIIKEGNNYRIITARYNVLIDSDFNIISTTSKEGKTYVYPSDKIGESTVEINSPVLNQNTVFNNKKSAEINAKYDAELAALEGTKPAEAKPVAPTVATDLKKFRKNIMQKGGKTNLRLKLDQAVADFTGENWKEIEDFMKENFKTIPAFRIKNILQATGGRQAWGAYQDGSVYIYENAEIGTAYHEIFHAVWDIFLTTEEKTNIVSEFRDKKGKYTDRLGEEIEYKKATIDQINEKLAEEYREHRLSGELPAKPTEGMSWIRKFFTDLSNFIKTFFTGERAQTNTANLFKKMGSGYYANAYNPYQAQLQLAQPGIVDLEQAALSGRAVFSLIAAGLTVSNINDIMQQMTYTTLLQARANTNEGLFSVEDLDRKELYDALKDDIEQVVYGSALDWATNTIKEDPSKESEVAPILANYKALRDTIFANWDAIVKKHEEEYLSSYSVKLTDEEANFRNEYTTTGKGDEYNDSNQVDTFRKSSAAIKLLLATVPVLDQSGLNAVSSIGGIVLEPMGKVYTTLLNSLHNSIDINDMMERLRKLSLEQPQYAVVYSRLTNGLPNSVKDDYFKNIEDLSGLQLSSAFYKSFDLQNPEVKTTFVLQNGDVSISDATLANATDQISSEMESSIIKAIKNDGKFLGFNGRSFVHKKTKTGINEIDKEVVGSIDNNIKFLKKLGIDVNKESLEKQPRWQKRKFIDGVNGIKRSISDVTAVREITSKSLEITTRLREVGEVIALIQNTDFQTTFINLNGDLVQSFLGQNPLSNFHNRLMATKKLSDLEGTIYNYLLPGKDVYSQGSVILSKIYDSEGNKKANVEKYMTVGYTGGIVNELTNKKKGSSKVVYAERLIEELNLNLKGVYMNLVPGDASLGWLLSMGNHITASDIFRNNRAVHDIFKNYIISELELSREHRDIAKVEGRKNTDLRFFKGILGESLHNDIVAVSEEKEGDEFKYTTEEVYNQFVEKIIKASDKFLNDDITDRINTYAANGLIKKDLFGDTYSVKGIQLATRKNMPLDVLRNQIGAMSANYMINNIELHKLIYSDPYQYKDELKRIKSFSSPRQSLINNSKEWNAKANDIVNQEYKPKDKIGYTNMLNDYFNSIVLEDNISVNEALKYEQFKSTDGGGVISFKAHRNLAVRSGNWNLSKERQYQYDIAYEKGIKKLPMSPFEKAVLKAGNPGITSAYTPNKPIVTGRKLNENNYNDVLLDKFALYPLSFRVLHQMNPESNAIKLYNKMQDGNIDYAVYDSGRKVGGAKKVALYNSENEFDTTPIAEDQVTKVPFSIMGIQTEVPSKETGEVTRGSQVTKLVTLDFLDCGVPLDFMTGKDFEERLAAWNELESEDAKLDASEIYRELKNNENLLNELTNIGYEELLEDIGWDGKDGKLDLNRLGDFLYSQVIKGNADENILKSIESLKLGNKDVEATPAYSQIRNTLYAIARDKFISPTMSGGLKVQIPSALLEAGGIKKAMVNGKEGLVSDVLNFYTNAKGEVVAEIMAARWFDSKLTDEELMDYFNNTDEGRAEAKKLLKGVSFRTPTQKQNSIDVVKIAKFLPKEFGDSVVIPAAMVAKVGSDFDIDKLSIYLKNVIVDEETGYPRVVPFYGIGAKDKFATRGEYKKSIQNAYIESMENLVGHPANFDRLVKPNSADPLKELADVILKLKGKTKTDYSSVTNMLRQTTMSKIRHAFVSGKYAIGIAATAQTNHSLNQRGMVIFNPQFDVKPGDSSWLKNRKLSFDKFNSIKPFGKTSYATLSRIKDAEGMYDISDVIGMFIDGYVDISKGDWIMDLGATPEVAGTWLTLVKFGVPIDTVAYFMNQPIIVDYLASLQTKGSTYLFSYDDVNNIKESKKYGVERRSSLVKEGILTRATLKKNVGQTTFDDKAKGQQQFILDEFLKYAKMSEMLLRVTQSTNFDTTNINDPSLVYMMNEKVKQNGPDQGNTNALNSGTENILINSYIGNLYQKLLEITNIYGNVLVSGKQSNREALENNILSRYLGLSKDRFVDIARKALNSVFDYATQVNSELNKSLGTLLVGKDSIGKQIDDLIQEIKEEGEDHPLANNLIIKSLRYTPSVKEGGADELKLVAKDNKSYDKNQIIYSFSELKNYLKDNNQEDLYKGLIAFSVVQSGLINSPISFTQFIPYEDFIEYYQENINSLNSTTINTFGKVGAFERNNWNNPDLVSYKKAYYETGEDDVVRYNAPRTLNPMYDLVKAEIANKNIPQLITIPKSDMASRKDYVVFTWEEGTEDAKKEMKEANDLSYVRKGLFKKVIQPDTDTPLLAKGNNYVFKQINAWGDGMRANEFYDHARKSAFNNGFDPVENEVDDRTIVNLYGVAKQGVKEDLSLDEMSANWENFHTLDENEPEDSTIENIEEESSEIEKDEVSLETDNTQRDSVIENMDYRQLYREAKKVDSPADARGLALEYFALGGKIGSGSLFTEVITRRDERFVSPKRVAEEVNSRDYVTKVGPGIKEVAHSIWDNLPEDIQSRVDDQDIRDEIISVVSSYLKRQSIAKEYIRAYSEATLKELDPIAALVNQYGVENINGKMLEGLGYTPKQIGNILKQIC